MTANTTVLAHGLAIHKLTLMRDHRTRPSRFRRLVQQASLILCSEMTRDLSLTDLTVRTPNDADIVGKVRNQGELVIMPILRAGLPMAESFAQLIPMARMAHVGIYRGKEGQRECYMLSLPRAAADSRYLLLDVTMSGGNTMALAVDFLIANGVAPAHIRCGCILVSEPGLQRFHEAHPEVQVFTIAVDPNVNELGHIIPGLGNPSARMFRTDEAGTQDMEEGFE